MLGDKAYDSAELRDELHERGTQPVIPNRSNRKQPFRFSKRLYKLRWRIERDYQELKQELGLGHFEGRGWRGFHHHATLCIAAYGFLISERETIPPSGPARARLFGQTALSQEHRTRRTADPAGATRSTLDRNRAAPPGSCPGARPPALPLLRQMERHAPAKQTLMTQ